jgi:hypothetical protein
MKYKEIVLAKLEVIATITKDENTLTASEIYEISTQVEEIKKYVEREDG